MLYPLSSVAFKKMRLIILIVPMIAMMLAAVAVVFLITSFGIAIVLAIMVNIDRVVPIIANEIDRHPTSVVLATVFIPILFVARRNVQINRRWRSDHGHLTNNDRRGVNQFRLRRIADFDATVKSWLSNAHRNPHIAGKSRPGRHDCGNERYTCE